MRGIRHTFRAEVSRVERHAVFFRYCWVELALHVVDRLGDETKAEESVGIKVVEKT